MANANDAYCNDELKQRIQKQGNDCDIEHIHSLCLEARVLEAAQALKTLESRLESVLDGECVPADARSARERLKSDPMYAKLRLVYGRLEPYLHPEVGLLMSALRGSDEKWARGVMRDKRISDSFRLEVGIRFLEGKECDVDGAPTQVLIRIRIVNWPQGLADAIALDKETDLGSKLTIADCKSFAGIVGGPEQLMSSMIHYVIRPSQFPVISIDFLQLREYALCHQSPLSEYAAGVFVTENTPPCDGGDFEGWTIPTVKFGTKRICQQTVKHFCWSPECPNTSTQTIVMKAALNIPKLLVSANLIKNIILRTTLTTFVNTKLEVVDKWAERGFVDRIAKERTFYDAVSSIR